jgi:hypothetical protein
MADMRKRQRGGDADDRDDDEGVQRMAPRPMGMRPPFVEPGGIVRPRPRLDPFSGLAALSLSERGAGEGSLSQRLMEAPAPATTSFRARPLIRRVLPRSVGSAAAAPVQLAAPGAGIARQLAAGLVEAEQAERAEQADRGRAAMDTEETAPAAAFGFGAAASGPRRLQFAPRRVQQAADSDTEEDSEDENEDEL